MARKIAVEIVGDSRSLERAFKRSSKSAQNFNKDVDKTGKGRKALDSVKSSAAGMAAGFIGISAITSGIKTSIQSASDLGEQMSKTRAVFKGSSGEILNWSKSTATALGTSREQALEAAGTFGNMLVPMGLARGKAADMSRSMVDLAADLSSFNNASPEDTLEALRSGLAGESEPLRKFGIFLSDARLKQEAMRLGLYKGKGALDANAKAQATYALILKDSKDAQGDFARTSGSLANQQRIFSAQIGDLAAKLGAILLPQLTNATKAVTDWLSKSKNQKSVMDTIKAAVDVLSTGLGILKTAFSVLSTVVGGNANAIKVLIAAYAGWKILTIASRVNTLATSFVGLTGKTQVASTATGTFAGKQRGAKAAAGKLKTSIGGVSKSMVGKAGLVGAAGLAAYELTTMFLHATHLDKKLHDLGGTVYDLAANLGLVKDPLKKFEGKKAPNQKEFASLRRQAAAMEARGVPASTAAKALQRQHPRFALVDLEAIAGIRSPTGTVGAINIQQAHFHGVQNPRQMEEALAKRTRQRPHPRRRGSDVF